MNPFLQYLYGQFQPTPTLGGNVSAMSPIDPAAMASPVQAPQPISSSNITSQLSDPWSAGNVAGLLGGVGRGAQSGGLPGALGGAVGGAAKVFLLPKLLSFLGL